MCVDADVRVALLRQHKQLFFRMIVELSILEDDGANGSDYEGEQKIPAQLAETLGTICSSKCHVLR